MKTKTFVLLCLLIGIAFTQLSAQNKAVDCVTKGNETYSIINISRSYTFQEKAAYTKKFNVTVFINEKPVCEISCRSRVSIKVYSEGDLKLTLKFLGDEKHPQEKMDKSYHQGSPLELSVKNGNTYYLNVDLNWNQMKNYLLYQIVKIPESEGMFKEEDRYEETPEIYLYEYRL